MITRRDFIGGLAAIGLLPAVHNQTTARPHHNHDEATDTVVEILQKAHYRRADISIIKHPKCMIIDAEGPCYWVDTRVVIGTNNTFVRLSSTNGTTYVCKVCDSKDIKTTFRDLQLQAFYNV